VAGTRRGPRLRLLAVSLVVVGVVALGGYTVYAGAAGSDDFLHPPRSEDCRTPTDQFGWAYEAVNYDAASDSRLRPLEVGDPPTHRCAWADAEPAAVFVPAPAGDAVLTIDGLRIAAWYISAASAIGPTGPTIVVVHGRSSNKSDYLRYAVSLHEQFNLVVFDLRNAGQSDAGETTLGVRERLDVEAVLDWLERVKKPRWIGGIGTSLGGSALLVAAVDDERLQALVLDSLHADIVTTWGNGVAEIRGLPAQPAGWAIVTAASLRVGEDIVAVDPVRLIGRLGSRPVLLTHGGQDTFDVPSQSLERNLAAAIVAGVPIEAYVCPAARHAGVADACPEEFAAISAEFFGRAASAALRDQ